MTRQGRSFLLALLPLVIALLSALWLIVRDNNDVVAFLLVRPASTLAIVGVVITGILSMRLLVRRWQTDSYTAGERQAYQRAITERHYFLEQLDHEIKQPVGTIRLDIATLKLEGCLSEELEASIKTEMDRINTLIVSLRKISSVAQPLESEPIDLRILIQEVWNLAKERDRGAARRWELAALPLVPIIQGDRDLLFQAFRNLLDNAFKFTTTGDMIACRMMEQGRNIVIEIEDSGQGIAAEDLPHIWHESYRADNAETIAGSGLGLVLVRTIIRRHNGSIDVASQLKHGTTFAIKLPVR